MSYLSPLNAGGSDSKYVKNQYEEHWGKKIEGIKKKINNGETLEHIIMNLRNRGHLIQGYNRVGGNIAKLFLQNFVGKLENKPLSRLAVTESMYSIQSNFDPITYLLKSAHKYTNIVELGAGPGWNLFNIASFLGLKKKSRKFFGLEYSSAGIEIMKLLGNYGKINLVSSYFDYTKPDLSIIPDDKPTIFFSHHSIEQVQEISGDLYDQISKRKSKSKLIHIEPIGWQRFYKHVDARINDDDEYFYDLIHRRLDNLNSINAVSDNAAINSWRVKYNFNALNLIFEKEKNKILKVQNIIYDFTHSTNQNPVNPSTFLEIDF